MSLPSPLPIVVDTDVVSYLFKRDTRASLYRPHLAGHWVILSFMTLAELEYWAETRQWGAQRRTRLESFLSGYTVHFPDRDGCRIWARAMAAARRAGRPIGPADAWIAVTALLHGVPLVTHNPNDYAGVPGLSLLSELGR
jgi:tRNA(fMet)-specific endonuclease VapC